MTLCTGVDLDLQCALFKNETAYTHLEDAMAHGLTTMDAIRKSALRVLTAKYALGLFERPFAEPAAAAPSLNTPAHKALALRAAEEGIVLLKNKGGVLPLSAETAKKIAVIGANGGCEPSAMLCDGRTNLLGSYSSYIHCEQGTSLSCLGLFRPYSCPIAPSSPHQRRLQQVQPVSQPHE